MTKVEEIIVDLQKKKEKMNCLLTKLKEAQNNYAKESAEYNCLKSLIESFFYLQVAFHLFSFLERDSESVDFVVGEDSSTLKDVDPLILQEMINKKMKRLFGGFECSESRLKYIEHGMHENLERDRFPRDFSDYNYNSGVNLTSIMDRRNFYKGLHAGLLVVAKERENILSVPEVDFYELLSFYNISKVD